MIRRWIDGDETERLRIVASYFGVTAADPSNFDSISPKDGLTSSAASKLNLKWKDVAAYDITYMNVAEGSIKSQKSAEKSSRDPLWVVQGKKSQSPASIESKSSVVKTEL